jgi:hypothetical protein
MQRGCGEKIERNFAHQFDTGGMDRLWVRVLESVHKKLLIQAAACDLALLMRSLYGAGKPKAAHDGLRTAIFAILGFMSAVEAFWQPPSVSSWLGHAKTEHINQPPLMLSRRPKSGCLDPGRQWSAMVDCFTAILAV